MRVVAVDLEQYDSNGFNGSLPRSFLRLEPRCGYALLTLM